MPKFGCNLDAKGKPLNHVWSHTIGSGHAAETLRADWQQQMRRTHNELGCEYVRFHAILDDDMAVALDEMDTMQYGFHNADLIFDFLTGIGMRPFVELSFMPSALSSGNQTVFNYRGNITPPKDYNQWSKLIDMLVRHWVSRYSIAEVRKWFFEVWNEPNLDAFWAGGQASYFELYRHTATTIKAVDPALKVGGPATANDEWIGDFMVFCRREKLSFDFISTHHYPTDALGKPGDDTETQLSLAPRDVLPSRVRKVYAEAGGVPVYYTEWCSSSNPFFHRHDEPYAAAFLVKNFIDVADLVKAYSWWTFSDIFSENYFSSAPFHGGFGLLTIDGIAKPTYRAFQLLHRLGNERLAVDGTHATVDCTVVRGDHKITVLLTNHAFPKHPIQTEQVSVGLRTAHPPKAAWIERIDEDHCNPRRLWESLGSPPSLSPAQVRQLDEASALQRTALAWQQRDKLITLGFELPAHAVAAITLEFSA
ncbi:MAG: GH39 family glycosyl hydrolase [Gammaproteobacteria bacterium]